MPHTRPQKMLDPSLLGTGAGARRAHLRRPELRVHPAEHGKHKAGGLATAIVRLGN